MEPYYHQPEHFLFEVPTSFSLPTIEPCPLKLELWHSRVIRAGVVFPADPNLPLSNHGCHFMGWVFWYSRVCLVSITGQQLNQWLNRFGSGFFKVHLFSFFFGGGKCSFVHGTIRLNKSVHPFFIDAICHKSPEHHRAHFTTISFPSSTLLY